MGSDAAMLMTTMVQEQRERWFKPGSQVHAKKSADVLRKEHEGFKKRVARALKLEKSKASLPGGIANTKDELDRQIAEVQTGTQSSGPLSIEGVETATSAHNAYQQERLAGGKKVANAFQRKLNDFAQFISAFDGLMETIASAGSPYGEIGYQTLSILLIVVVNKTKNDTRIVEHLADIRKSFPRLDAWQDIYPNDTMRQLVADAYLQILEFSRAAVEYFTQFWHRLHLAINPLAAAELEDSVNGLHKTLAEINAEAMMGLHGTSRIIKQTVVSLGVKAETAELDRKKLLADNQKLIEQNEHAKRERDKLLLEVQELRAKIVEQASDAQRRERQEDLRKLAIFQELLGVPAGSDLASTSIASVKKTLMEVFPNDLRFSPLIPHTAYVQVHESEFRTRSQYRQWADHTLSSLLFISGATAPEGRKFRNYRHSWLSPAAIYIAEGFVSQGDKVAFFSCLPDLDSPRISSGTLLSSLILQALHWRPEILREGEAQFIATLQSTHHRSREHMLIDLLGDVLLAMQDLGTVYLVIDRLDCCERKIKDTMNELARLVTVLRSLEFRVKIAIVAETSGGGGTWNWEYLPEHEFATDRIFVIAEDQRRLTTSEASLLRRPSIWSTPQTSSQSATAV